MMLALVVTIVGISAAWFSNSTYKTQDGFIIGSDTVSEFASIKVDSNIAGQGGTTIWPAISSMGYLMTGVQAPQLYPSTTVTTGVNNSIIATANANVTQGAKCANIYFPIKFIGGSDDGETDGRKSLLLELQSVTIDKYSTIEDDKVIDFTQNFREFFNVEMYFVEVVKTGEGDDAKYEVNSRIESNLATSDIYYEQTNGVKGDNCSLYMLVRPGTEYYVCATVYFNQVDEECNPELLYTTIRFNFKINQEVDRLESL